jgi:putative ABC transport system permease protein
LKVVTKSFLRHLTRRRSLSIMQLLGIVCGVAGVVGMSLAAETALSSLSRAVDFLRGQSTHLMERPAGSMDERVLRALMADSAVDAFSPVIDRRVRLKDGESVRVLGFDPFLDQAIRPGLAKSRSESFLLNERSIFVEAGLAQDLGVKPGQGIPTSMGLFEIDGTFVNPAGEPLLLMDIAHAQTIFELPGQIDRVDLRVNDERAFRSRWSTGFRIQSHGQTKKTLSAMVRAFRLNLEALSLLALFVGIFLVYNTAMFTVVNRRKDAGILRSLGARRYEIVIAFLTEILLFGIIGGALGGLAGYLLSRFLTVLIGGTISNLYFFLRPGIPHWSWWIPLLGALLGCGASLLGSFFPLMELVRLDPVHALHGRVAGRESRDKARTVAVLGTGVLIVGFVFLLMADVNVYLGFAGTFGVILGFSLFAGLVLRLLGPAMRWVLNWLGGLSGKIATGNILRNLGRTGVAVAAFMVALSMSVGLGTMIGSFRESLIWWMESQLTGDIYVSMGNEMIIPEAFYHEVKAIPGIGGVNPYRNVQMAYRDKPISVTSVDASVLERYTHFSWFQGGNENWGPVKRGAVVISESFSRNFGLHPGDTVSLTGIRGPVRLPVQAVFYDYSTEHGLIMMDRSTYLRVFGDHALNSVSLFIDPGNPRRHAIIHEAKRRAHARALPVYTRDQLHARVLTLFDSTFAVTRSMRALALLVAFFGIAGALMTLFIERQRELGIYRALGFSRGQVAAMTLLEALGMGLISFVLSTVTGTVLAVILIKVINLHSFNWTIFFHLAWQPYILAFTAALLASIGAALYPIWKVCRTYPQMQIREE